jgi:bis(5'-adenosyl)-triphosphatase
MNFDNFIIDEDQIIAKTRLSFIMINIKPFLPHHILICPIRIEPRVKGLTSEEFNDLMDVLHRVIKGLDSICSAWNISIQDGKDAGQTVRHLHIHVVPRTPQDLERNDDLHEALERGYERRILTNEERKKESNFLRKVLKDNGVVFD